jgi:hypothetical protein
LDLGIKLTRRINSIKDELVEYSTTHRYSTENMRDLDFRSLPWGLEPVPKDFLP